MPQFFKNENIVRLTPNNFDPKTLKINHPNFKNKPGFVMFFAPWCGFCKQAKPVFSDLANHVGGKDLAIGAFDCEKYSDFSSKLGVSSYPTFKYIHDGKMAKEYKKSGSDYNALVGFLCKQVDGSFCKTSRS